MPAERTVPHLLPEADEFTALPEVLATGYLVGILEWTCLLALAGHLDDDEATLSVHVDITHEAPTPPGTPVTVEVELTATDGRTLTFTVQARDDLAVISRGTHRRAVITPPPIQRPSARPHRQNSARSEHPVGDRLTDNVRSPLRSGGC